MFFGWAFCSSGELDKRKVICYNQNTVYINFDMEAYMNLTHLRYMVEVERHGSITKAAAALYMGQPNLSKAIKELEREFGVPIFRRSAKGVIPTEKGKEFLLHAKAILSQVEKMEQLSREDTARRGYAVAFCGGTISLRRGSRLCRRDSIRCGGRHEVCGSRNKLAQ